MLDEELATVFASIAETMLGAELRMDRSKGARLGAGSLTALIQFSGSFEGVLKATFSAKLALTIASVMLQQPCNDSSQTDVRDAVGELVNIAAGNLKAVLPYGCQLSLPRVQAGDPKGARTSRERLGIAHFRLFGEPMWVELVGATGASVHP